MALYRGSFGRISLAVSSVAAGVGRLELVLSHFSRVGGISGTWNAMPESSSMVTKFVGARIKIAPTNLPTFGSTRLSLGIDRVPAYRGFLHLRTTSPQHLRNQYKLLSALVTLLDAFPMSIRGCFSVPPVWRRQDPYEVYLHGPVGRNRSLLDRVHDYEGQRGVT